MITDTAKLTYRDILGMTVGPKRMSKADMQELLINALAKSSEVQKSAKPATAVLPAFIVTLTPKLQFHSLWFQWWMKERAAQQRHLATELDETA